MKMILGVLRPDSGSEEMFKMWREKGVIDINASFNVRG